MDTVGEWVGGAAALSALAVAYLTPTLIAWHRRQQRALVTFVNVLAGWSVAGWVLALWLAASRRGPTYVYVPYPVPARPDPEPTREWSPRDAIPPSTS